jgi:hypothetical protein
MGMFLTCLPCKRLNYSDPHLQKYLGKHFTDKRECSRVVASRRLGRSLRVNNAPYIGPVGHGSSVLSVDVGVRLVNTL